MARIFNCSDAHRRIISQTFPAIQNVLDNWDLPCLTDVRDQLQDYLNCLLEIACEDCDIDGQTREDDAIVLCRDALDSNTLQRTTAVAFHEMVHAAGGTELDSEALENHFFALNGATMPTSGDFADFRSNGGNFVEWVEDTGELFELCMDDSYNISRGSALRPVFLG